MDATNFHVFTIYTKIQSYVGLCVSVDVYCDIVYV